MASILDSVYFGRLDRLGFFVMISGLTAGFAMAVAWLFAITGGPAGAAAIAAIHQSGNLLDGPGIMLAHGLSDARIVAATLLLALYLVAALFMIAARMRDAGLPGWPVAFAALPFLLFGGSAGPAFAGLAALLALGTVLWPSRRAA
ncbi:hypothetical protein LNKW23_44540 [Paralimibaculum aggregatum]|uniref:Uncharacterized protein n=1 Tax=Paralimibaculum aggregatum TaxID=3036245 RepID=A0ABQ6LT43_9RHOB|nr:hypothetical protein [Limibaculum sp. NKW23]GMG85237.1 hypothetical protein LNKW23_44540 [Limibaculum sp. NKW23]